MSNFNKIKRFVSIVTIGTFLLSTILPSGFARAQVIPLGSVVLNLPAPDTMVLTSPEFIPPMLKGLIIHPEKPFQFEFVLDSGDSQLTQEELKSESEKLIKYFLASLTMPEKDLWVNLSPHEKDRIIVGEFAKTEMGRDLLAQDYILKQLTASLIYPENELGKKFWDRVYKKAKAQFGTTEIPVNTFNKVWIVPDTAKIFENNDRAFVIEGHLKVMLEEDYVAMSNQKDRAESRAPARGVANSEEGLANSEKDLTANRYAPNADKDKLSSDIIREIIIPAIEKEVNEGQNFAKLRQIYYSFILASWYKKNLQNSILTQKYADQKKVAGLETNDGDIKNKIYDQYMQAFKKGAYDYIKEDYDADTQSMIPRKYFSGGMELAFSSQTTTQRFIPDGATYVVAGEFNLPSSESTSNAMVAQFTPRLPRWSVEEAIRSSRAISTYGVDLFVAEYGRRDPQGGNLFTKYPTYETHRGASNAMWRDALAKAEETGDVMGVKAIQRFRKKEYTNIWANLIRDRRTNKVGVIFGSTGSGKSSLSAFLLGSDIEVLADDNIPVFEIDGKLLAMGDVAPDFVHTYYGNFYTTSSDQLSPIEFMVFLDDDQRESPEATPQERCDDFIEKGTMFRITPQAQQERILPLFTDRQKMPRLILDHESANERRSTDDQFEQEVQEIKSWLSEQFGSEAENDAMAGKSASVDALYNWAQEHQGQSFREGILPFLRKKGWDDIRVKAAEYILGLFDVKVNWNFRGGSLKEETKTIVRFAMQHQGETLPQTGPQILKDLGISGKVTRQNANYVFQAFDIRTDGGKDRGIKRSRYEDDAMAADSLPDFDGFEKFLRDYFQDQEEISFVDIGAGPTGEFGVGLREVLEKLGKRSSLNSVSIDQVIRDKQAEAEGRVVRADALFEEDLERVGLEEGSRDLVAINNVESLLLLKPAVELLKKKGVLLVTFAQSDIQTDRPDFVTLTKKTLINLSAENPDFDYFLLGGDQIVRRPNDYPTSNETEKISYPSHDEMIVLIKRPVENNAMAATVDRLRNILEENAPDEELAQDKINSSAVVLIRKIKEQWHVLLTKRSAGLDYQGIWALPGGKIDEKDVSSQDTALREFGEELGVPLSEEDVLGRLSHQDTIDNKYRIFPFVAFAEKDMDFNPNRGEVEDEEWVPLDQVFSKRVVIARGAKEVDIEIGGAAKAILSKFFDVVMASEVEDDAMVTYVKNETIVDYEKIFHNESALTLTTINPSDNDAQVDFVYFAETVYMFINGKLSGSTIFRSQEGQSFDEVETLMAEAVYPLENFPEKRGKGYGNITVAALISIASRLGFKISEDDTKNPALIKAYRKYLPIGHIPDPVDEEWFSFSGIQPDPARLQDVSFEMRQVDAPRRFSRDKGRFQPILAKTDSAKAILARLQEKRALDVENNAMAATSRAQDTSHKTQGETDVGGIDFDPKHLDIQSEGNKVTIPLPSNPQEWENINIQGLVPFIYSITPVSNIPFLLGEVEEQEDEMEVSRI